MAKLWLALEDRDIGYTIIATESTKLELEAWFAANPDKIIGTEVGIVESKKPIVITHWEPVTVQAKQYQPGKGLVSVSDMILTIDEMKTWAKTKGSFYGYHKLHKSNWTWHLVTANCEEDTKMVGGKFDSIVFTPVTVEIYEDQGN